MHQGALPAFLELHHAMQTGAHCGKQERSMKHPSLMDPWSRTLAMLDDRSSRRTETSRTPSSLMHATVHSGRHADEPLNGGCVNIRLLERLSESTLALSWHDPTSFNYSEQVWALCTARKRGVCVLSGQAIRRGQPVYRPRRVGSSVPLNSGAMILALALAPGEHASNNASDTSLLGNADSFAGA
jgi:hypothetical protein